MIQKGDKPRRLCTLRERVRAPMPVPIQRSSGPVAFLCAPMAQKDNEP
jgi:hypothetical protein